MNSSSLSFFWFFSKDTISTISKTVHITKSTITNILRHIDLIRLSFGDYFLHLFSNRRLVPIVPETMRSMASNDNPLFSPSINDADRSNIIETEYRINIAFLVMFMDIPDNCKYTIFIANFLSFRTTICLLREKRPCLRLSPSIFGRRLGRGTPEAPDSL